MIKKSNDNFNKNNPKTAILTTITKKKMQKEINCSVIPSGSYVFNSFNRYSIAKLWEYFWLY